MQHRMLWTYPIFSANWNDPDQLAIGVQSMVIGKERRQYMVANIVINICVVNSVSFRNQLIR